WLTNKKNRRRLMWILPLVLLGSTFGGDQVKAVLNYVFQAVTTGTLPQGLPPIAIGTAPQAPAPTAGTVPPSSAPPGSAPGKPVAATPVARTSATPAGHASNDGPIRVYFSRPGPDAQAAGNIAQICAFYIDQTRQSLDVAAFELDNRVIVEALVRAVQRGVRLRLVT